MGHSGFSTAFRTGARRITSDASHRSQHCPHWPARIFLIQRHTRAVSFYHHQALQPTYRPCCARRSAPDPRPESHCFDATHSARRQARPGLNASGDRRDEGSRGSPSPPEGGGRAHPRGTQGQRRKAAQEPAHVGEARARVQELRAQERPERELPQDHRRGGRGRCCVLVNGAPRGLDKELPLQGRRSSSSGCFLRATNCPALRHTDRLHGDPASWHLLIHSRCPLAWTWAELL